MRRLPRAHIVLYGFFLFVGATVWYPFARNSIRDWCEARRLREGIGVVYTTDTRGYLEGCG